MAKKEQVKVITTGVLVVLLLGVFVVAFLNRNEISQKLQTLGKTPETSPERLIVEEWKPTTPATIPSLETNQAKNLQTESIPDLSSVPAESETGGKGAVLPKQEKKPEVPVSEETETTLETSPTTQAKLTHQEPSIPPRKRSRVTNHTRKKKMARTRTKTAPAWEKRVRQLEMKFGMQSRTAEARFREIEDRISKLEKSLEKPSAE